MPLLSKGFCEAVGKIGQGKRHFVRAPGLIREKLAAMKGSTIALNIVVMNLEKLLELFCLFCNLALSFSLSLISKKAQFVYLSTRCCSAWRSVASSIKLSSLAAWPRIPFLRKTCLILLERGNEGSAAPTWWGSSQGRLKVCPGSSWR